MSQRIFPLILLLCGCVVSAFAQNGEMNASVRVNTPQLQNTERKVFDQLEVALKDFINNTKWTQDPFEPEERVECSFIITVSEEIGTNTFKGELAIQAVRPVFGTGYKSPLISHLDRDFVFSYDQNQPIEFLPNSADNQNLSAMAAFYVYVILGLDYDSFSLYGGDIHLLAAQQLVTNIQNQPSAPAGWKPADGGKNRNRYWIIENLLNPRVKPYRAAMYTYYRKGMDVFSTNIEQGKGQIMAALEEVDKVNVAYFNSMIVQMFANAKRDELVEMWKVGPRAQRDRVVQIMSKIDPANGQRYREILN